MKYRLTMPHDVRSIANFVLDLTEKDGLPISNLAINKIVFFLHAHFLVEFDRPLISAKVEAWQHGPVFRELYREFKGFGDQPITGRAHRMSPETGRRELCTYQFSDEELSFLQKLTRKYAELTPAALRAMSHEKEGPWDQVWNHDTRSNASMNISNEIIKNWYDRAARH